MDDSLIYDVSTDSWTVGPMLPRIVSNHGVEILEADGDLVIYCGGTRSGTGTQHVTPLCNTYRWAHKKLTCHWPRHPSIFAFFRFSTDVHTPIADLQLPMASFTIFAPIGT